MDNRPFEDRFWSRIARKDFDDDCWLWTGCLNSSGYGVITRNGKQLLVHRVSFVMHYRDLKEKEVIRHTCDNPPCVNPAHLIAGSTGNNIKDQWDRKRRPQQLRKEDGTWTQFDKKRP